MPAPMDYSAHELHDPSRGATIQGNDSTDVMALQNMLAAAEQQEAEHRRAEQQALAADLYEDLQFELPKHPEPMGQAPDISDWLADISKRDNELRKHADVTRLKASLPPVRNADKGPKKRVQVGPSSVEKEKEMARGGEAPKGPSKKQQKYYSYDYFKEWDKFDVDKEIERIEEEEKKKDEYARFSKAAADVDSPEEVHDTSKTYQVEEMTPLEKRMAAKREKEKGNECMKAGEINAAVGFYSKALELVPGDQLVLGNRAQSYIGIKCYYQAELDCDKALAIEPGYAKARYRRAVSREEQGKLEEAKLDYDILLVENPEHTLGKQRSAVNDVKLRKKQEAEEAVRKAEEERKKYDSAPRRKIQITELDDDDDDDDDDGMDAEALKKARDAIKQKEEEKSSGSRFTEVTEDECDEKKSRRLKSGAEERILKVCAAREEKEKGNNMFKAKDLVGAVRHYSRSLDLLPEDDTEERHLVLCNRALVLLQQTKLAEAEADCSEAIKVNVKWAKAWHRRGVAKYKNGRLGESLEDLEQALKLEPNSKSTLDEIKIVRDLQISKRKEAPAAGKMRVQIEEVETDSEDDDVVVVNSPGSKNKPGPQGDKDSASPPKSGPGDSLGAGAKKVQVMEVDDDDSDADEGEIIDDDAAVSVAPSGRQSSERAKIVMIEEVDDEVEEEVLSAAGTSKSQNVPPEAAGAGKATKKVAIDEVDSEEEEAPGTPAAAADKTSIAAASPQSMVVEEDEDSDEDEAVVEAIKEAKEEPPVPAPGKRAAWDETTPGLDLPTLRAGKKIKEEADVAFKAGLFEKAVGLYSGALEKLGYEDDFAAEQAVCCLNRAACNLQVREYGQVIADCGQVLDWDADNVKAYLRRGLAYEGTGRFGKAAADMRDALSIEFASGGLTALGSKARECLERCKKAEPELRAIPIPVRDTIMRAAPAPAAHSSSSNTPAKHAGTAAGSVEASANFIAAEKFEGSKPGFVFKKDIQGVGYYKDAHVDPSGCAEDDIKVVMDQTNVDRARAITALKRYKDAAGAILAIEDENDPKPAAADGEKKEADFKFPAAEKEEKEEPMMAERMAISKNMEAEDQKNKGNAAFKASKYRSAIMHYSAAIDLDDNNATYYTNLAAAHNALKDYQNGIKMALAARKADPTYAKGVYRHAQALQGLGKLREALVAYEQGLELMPESKQMADGRTEVTKLIRDSDSSELNALAKLKAIKEEEVKSKAAAAKTQVAGGGGATAAGGGSKLQEAAGGASALRVGGAEGAPKSGAEIKKALRNMRKDLLGLFNYVSLCVPEQLQKLLSSGVEEEELLLLLKCVSEHGAAAAPQPSFLFLEGLAKVPRVPIVTAMLDRKDSKMLESLLLRLHPSKATEAAADAKAEEVTYDVARWAELCKAFGV